MNRTGLWMTGVCMLSSVFSPCQAGSLSIVPGKSLGQLALGDNLDKVNMGPSDPDRSDAAMGKSWTVYVSKTSHQPDGSFNTLSVYATRNFGHDQDAAHVTQIRVTSSAFHTASGISTASSLRSIERTFPRAHRVAWYKDSPTYATVDLYDDIEHGIAFEVIRWGRTLAITVHERNSKVTELYLGQHTYHPVR